MCPKSDQLNRRVSSSKDCKPKSNPHATMSKSNSALHNRLKPKRASNIVASTSGVNDGGDSASAPCSSSSSPTPSHKSNGDSVERTMSGETMIIQANRIAFLYYPTHNRYALEHDASHIYSWQWTRHFLKRLNGKGEWLVENSFPPVLVMFLQILRYASKKDF